MSSLRNYARQVSGRYCRDVCFVCVCACVCDALPTRQQRRKRRRRHRRRCASGNAMAALIRFHRVYFARFAFEFRASKHEGTQVGTCVRVPQRFAVRPKFAHPIAVRRAVVGSHTHARLGNARAWRWIIARGRVTVRRRRWGVEISGENYIRKGISPAHERMP